MKCNGFVHLLINSMLLLLYESKRLLCDHHNRYWYFWYRNFAQEHKFSRNKVYNNPKSKLCYWKVDKFYNMLDNLYKLLFPSDLIHNCNHNINCPMDSKQNLQYNGYIDNQLIGGRLCWNLRDSHLLWIDWKYIDRLASNRILEHMWYKCY